MGAKVIDTHVQRVWKFSYNIEPGSAPDMKPWSGSREMMRPTNLRLVVQTAPDKPGPVVHSRTASGPKVLKGGTVSGAIFREAHLWSYDDPPPWIFELTEAALMQATGEMDRIND